MMSQVLLQLSRLMAGAEDVTSSKTIEPGMVRLIDLIAVISDGDVYQYVA